MKWFRPNPSLRTGGSKPGEVLLNVRTRFRTLSLEGEMSNS